ncbi:MAG: hypothetical protein H0X26_07360 [Alphaproteobacteria bacterium]|nr:hypothetical protein [Alphaproteobacteria bacterium]
MKFNILSTFAVTLFTFIGTADATSVTPKFSPGIPQTYSECMAALGTSHAACSALFAAKRACDTGNNSDNGEDWKECYGAAEKNYHESLGTAVATEAYVGEVLPVSTNTADAVYEFRDDGKGFLQSKEK